MTQSRDLLLSHPFSVRFVQQNASRFIGKTLVDCYKTSPEQTVFELADQHDGFYFITYFSNTKSFFFIKEDYGKPKSKYHTLYKALHGLDIIALSAYQNERSVGLYFENNQALILALFGRKNFVYHTQAAPNEEIELALNDKHFDLIPTMEMNLTPEFLTKLFKAKTYTSPQTDTIHVIEDQNQFVRLDFEVKKDQKALYSGHDTIEALNQYARTYFKLSGKALLLQKLNNHFNQKLKKATKALDAAQKQLHRITTELDYRMWADLLMAYAFQVKNDASETQLPHFETGELVTIPLKAKLNARENAERYYRKAKNQNKEIEALEKQIANKTKEIEDCELKLLELEEQNDFKELQNLGKGIFKETDQNAARESKFMEFEHMGYKIYVGRNSKNNDELTLHFAAKNDLWLHAKDLAGSHVVVRNKGSETNYPKPVIEVAAGLAAYYSKGRNQQMCPVIYTPKKFIRKPKGAPAGAVLVEREDIVFAQPSLP
ncbi:MAG: DUF814 domain-containing protein [Bacteroidetes bacterium]|nr:DUF814 domain-containing protein [Bacteroidota bacterium]